MSNFENGWRKAINDVNERNGFEPETDEAYLARTKAEFTARCVRIIEGCNAAGVPEAALAYIGDDRDLTIIEREINALATIARSATHHAETSAEH